MVDIVESVRSAFILVSRPEWVHEARGSAIGGGESEDGEWG